MSKFAPLFREPTAPTLIVQAGPTEPAPPPPPPSTTVTVEFGGRVVNADAGGPVANVQLSLDAL